MKKIFGRLLKKGDVFFRILFSISLIFCCIVFLHPKTIKTFREFSIFAWVIIPVMIYCCTIFLACCISFFILILSHFYLEIKKSITNHEYLAIVATLFGAVIFFLMIFPILKIAFYVFVYFIFGIKFKNV